MATNDAAVVLLDESIHRGDTQPFTIVLPARNLTGRRVYFTGKENRNIQSPRYIDKSSDEPSELSFSYADPDTTVIVYLTPEDTEDIQFELLQIDIESVDQFDIDNVETEASGTMAIVFDVRTEFDNYNLPDEPVTFQQVDASDFEVDSLIHVQEVNGVRTMVKVTIDELKIILGITP